MSCPFLAETGVRYCYASAARKMIAAGQGDAASERCGSRDHLDCELYRERQWPDDTGERCPFLHQSTVQYCSAASMTKFVPASQQVGRCGGPCYRFCDLYLGLSKPGRRVDSSVDGVPVPPHLYFTPDHLWLDVDANGSCHVGVDGFFAYVAGRVEKISFVTSAGVNRPSVVVTAGGVDWPMTFRNRLLITNVNLYLRSSLERLTADPYGAGWLFEGWQLPDAPASAGLAAGQQAVAWMGAERTRLDMFAHELAGGANDGGTCAPGILSHASREEALRLMHAFFAPERAWGEEPR